MLKSRARERTETDLHLCRNRFHYQQMELAVRICQIHMLPRSGFDTASILRTRPVYLLQHVSILHQSFRDCQVETFDHAPSLSIHGSNAYQPAPSSSIHSGNACCRAPSFAMIFDSYYKTCKFCIFLAPHYCKAFFPVFETFHFVEFR